jgi:hypothetical protein
LVAEREGFTSRCARCMLTQAPSTSL